MNKIDKNDPRLTAYALGELSDKEMKEVEQAIEATPELQKEVEEIHEMTSMLEDAFSLEEKLELNDEHRAEIKEAASKKAETKSFSSVFTFLRIGIPAAAAIVIVASIIGPQVMKNVSKSEESTRGAQERTAYNQQMDLYLDSKAPRPVKGVVYQPAPNFEKLDLAFNDSEASVYELEEADYDEFRSSALKKQAPETKALKESYAPVPESRPAEMTLAVAQAEKPAVILSKTKMKSQPAKRRSRKVGNITGEQYTPVKTERADDIAEGFNTEAYDHIDENEFKLVKDEALSTFSIDVDTASYANVRRFLNQNQLPPAGSIRIEEMVNYFTYDYPQPTTDIPFSVLTDTSVSPWHPGRKLVRIGLKGRDIVTGERPMSNLVFLLDVSGSMNNANKLPLLKKAMKLLVEQLGENDQVSIVVYAGASGVVLPSTTCDNKGDILSALEHLQAGGSTNGAGGIQLAYQTAVANYIKGGINRVILATDGDFNVGTTNRSELTDLIEKNAKSGVFLSVLGFGMGNYKDSTLETLADKGNGNYAYIDTIAEAEKVLVKQIGSTLVTIAKDVKIQVDFNRSKVHAYRLIGYENRKMAKEHFNDDTKDAGEIGAGHTVTALYEIVPVGGSVDVTKVEPSKYSLAKESDSEIASNELLEVRVRYKQPDSDTSSLLKFPLNDSDHSFASMNDDFRFAAGVATFGMILRNSKSVPNVTLDDVLRMAESSKDKPYRQEFIELVKQARRIRSTQ